MCHSSDRSIIKFWEHAAAKRHSRYGMLDLDAFTAFLKDPDNLLPYLLSLEKLRQEGFPENVVPIRQNYDRLEVFDASSGFNFACTCPHCGNNIYGPPSGPRPAA